MHYHSAAACTAARKEGGVGWRSSRQMYSSDVDDARPLSVLALLRVHVCALCVLCVLAGRGPPSCRWPSCWVWPWSRRRWRTISGTGRTWRSTTEPWRCVQHDAGKMTPWSTTTAPAATAAFNLFGAAGGPQGVLPPSSAARCRGCPLGITARCLQRRKVRKT